MEILRDMAETMRTMSQDIKAMTQDMRAMSQDMRAMSQDMKAMSRKLDRLPRETARELEASVFGKRFEREAESEVFTYGLQLGEMPQYPPKDLEPQVKAWRKARLMDGLLITDAGKIYVIQAKVNSRDWTKAVEQMGKALQRILDDLKKVKLQYRVVPVFAFEHVDHPGKLVKDFKNLKPYPGAEPPLLFLSQGVVVTYDGKRIRLY